MGNRSQSEKSVSGQRKSRPFWSCLTLAFLLFVGPQSASADTRLVVRDSLGLTGILNLCGLLGGCSTVRGLGDPSGQLFMIQVPQLVSSLTLPLLQAIPTLGIVSIETDQIVQAQGAKAGPAPSYLTDKTPITYYGTTVWRGYVYQPGNRLIQTDSAHAIYKVAGSGVTVAVIDTGVDPNHPVLKNSLVAGYDFTRNQSGGSEMSDVSQSTVAVLDSSGTAQVVSDSIDDTSGSVATQTLPPRCSSASSSCSVKACICVSGKWRAAVSAGPTARRTFAAKFSDWSRRSK